MGVGVGGGSLPTLIPCFCSFPFANPQVCHCLSTLSCAPCFSYFLLLSFAVASSTSPASPASFFRSCKLLLLLLLLLLSFAAASSYFSRFSCFFSSQLQGSFARSKRALEEIYETGSNILTSMSSNKERLKVSYFCPRCGSCQCQKHMGVDIHGMHMDLKPQTLGRATRSGSRCKYLYSTFMVCCL